MRLDLLAVFAVSVGIMVNTLLRRKGTLFNPTGDLVSIRCAKTSFLKGLHAKWISSKLMRHRERKNRKDRDVFLINVSLSCGLQRKELSERPLFFNSRVRVETCGAPK